MRPNHKGDLCGEYVNFNPRIPTRDATFISINVLLTESFQSTHPNAGCDPANTPFSHASFYFNPRIPTRDAT